MLQKLKQHQNHRSWKSKAIVEEAVVAEEVTYAEAAQESPVKEEPEVVVEEVLATEEFLRKLKLHQIHRSRKNLASPGRM